MEFEIWAGFEPAGSIKFFYDFAKVAYFWGWFFHFFMDKNKTKLKFLYIAASALKN